MSQVIRDVLAKFVDTGHYEALLWGFRALIVMPFASVLLPLLFSTFPVAVSPLAVVVILGVNWLIGIFILIRGAVGLIRFKQARLSVYSWRAVLKVSFSILRADLVNFSR
jgi:hypothetical protein